MSELVIRNLHAGINDQEILKGVDLTVGQGEVHALMGPNGTGKSALAYILMGPPSYEVYEGHVVFKGENILELKPDQRAHLGIFLAFQYPVAIPGVTVVVPYGNPDVAADSVASALFYLVAYAVTNFAAWAVVIALEQREEKGLELNDYAGLGRKHPALAAVMTVAMLSFTGVPPTIGFVGKFYLFRTVIEGGFIGLALIGVLTSLVSAYYYLRVVVIMYMQDGEPAVRRENWLYATAFVSAIAVVVLSIVSAPLISLATQAILELL